MSCCAVLCACPGDNKATAEAICRMIGVFDDNEDLSEHSFTGRQFSEMPETRQEALVRKKSNLVFSRAEPKHKQVWRRGRRRGAWCVCVRACRP